MFKMLRSRSRNHKREDIQKHREFKSCSDITITKKSIPLSKNGSEMHIHNLVKTPVSVLKSYVKTAGITNSEASSISKRIKNSQSMRHNMQVEKTMVLVAKMQDKINVQLFEKIQNYETLIKDYVFLKVNYDRALKEIEELEQERDLIKHEHEQMVLKIGDCESFIENLQIEANNLKQESQNLKEVNKILTDERNLFETNCNSLKQQNINLENREKMQLDVIKEQNRLLQVYKNHILELEDLRRFMHNQIQDLKGNVRVYCRVRPQLPWENDKLLCNFNYVDDKTLKIKRLKESICTTTGKSIERTIAVGTSVVDGYNVCIFAYGQTGSGKTFTMLGEKSKDSSGIIPRSVKLIFELIDKLQSIGWTYYVNVSFLEIYNEMVRDLLVSNSKENLEIQYNDGNGTIVKNLTTTSVHSAKELQALMEIATKNRVVAVTNFNERSSRSHSVTKIILNGVHEKNTYEGSLSLVDLAGSESLKKTESLLETKNINKSLSALASVMMALQNKETHIPYRNSKLTYLLQNCLSGNCKTLMFINIKPFDECYSESIRALRFAALVKKVKLPSKKNKSFIK
ncbi:hypothetical protein FQR65_LT10146 [Abscondita terminalis]|nr:hypothetical protein FQR65_LT10146 [Abscondita terminalis]